MPPRRPSPAVWKTSSDAKSSSRRTGRQPMRSWGGGGGGKRGGEGAPCPHVTNGSHRPPCDPAPSRLPRSTHPSCSQCPPGSRCPSVSSVIPVSPPPPPSAPGSPHLLHTPPFPLALWSVALAPPCPPPPAHPHSLARIHSLARLLARPLPLHSPRPLALWSVALAPPCPAPLPRTHSFPCTAPSPRTPPPLAQPRSPCTHSPARTPSRTPHLSRTPSRAPHLAHGHLHHGVEAALGRVHVGGDSLAAHAAPELGAVVGERQQMAEGGRGGAGLRGGAGAALGGHRREGQQRFVHEGAEA